MVGGREEKEPNLGSPTWLPSPAFRFQGVRPSLLNLLGETPEISSFFPGGRRPTKISLTKRQGYSSIEGLKEEPNAASSEGGSYTTGAQGHHDLRGSLFLQG